MTKVREAGSCAEAQWDAVRAIGMGKLGVDASDEASRAEGIAEVSRVLGLDVGTVRNILNPDRPEQLSLERAGILARAFGLDIFARWLAQESGGLFVMLPQATGDIEKLTAAGVRQVGETAAQIIEAVGDGSDDGKSLSLSEAQKVLKDSKTVSETFMRIAKIADGVITNLRKKARR